MMAEGNRVSIACSRSRSLESRTSSIERPLYGSVEMCDSSEKSSSPLWLTIGPVVNRIVQIGNERMSVASCGELQ